MLSLPTTLHRSWFVYEINTANVNFNIDHYTTKVCNKSQLPVLIKDWVYV